MGDFAVDRRKQATVLFGERRPRPREMLALWLINSELHCVAAYRFGRFAARQRERGQAFGWVLTLMHRVWNRRNTHLHHCEIDRGARIGPGLLLMHRQGIIVGPVVIGSDCVLHHNVTVGERVAGGAHGVPRIGNGVWIGPGAVLTGDIEIGDGVTVSAGAVVSRDIPPRSLVAGNPARVIAQNYDNAAINRIVVRSGPSAS